MNKQNRILQNRIFKGVSTQEEKVLHAVSCRGDSSKSGGREIFLHTHLVWVQSHLSCFLISNSTVFRFSPSHRNLRAQHQGSSSDRTPGIISEHAQTRSPEGQHLPSSVAPPRKRFRALTEFEFLRETHIPSINRLGMKETS